MEIELAADRYETETAELAFIRAQEGDRPSFFDLIGTKPAPVFEGIGIAPESELPF